MPINEKIDLQLAALEVPTGCVGPFVWSDEELGFITLDWFVKICPAPGFGGCRVYVRHYHEWLHVGAMDFMTACNKPRDWFAYERREYMLSCAD